MNQVAIGVKRWHPALLLVMGVVGPPVIAFMHLLLTIILRTEVKNFPDALPIEYISLVLFLIGLAVLLHRRGAPVWMLVISLVISGLIAGLAGLIALFAAGALSGGLPKC
ncbi:MAG TPA: hypothetical protein VJQ56_12145 [Blastocatellia bacterium]|nr:hypothetical protein [Blastocatellia bacterium]